MLTSFAVGNKDHPDRASLFILEMFSHIKITTIFHTVLISRVFMFRESFKGALQKTFCDQIYVANIFLGGQSYRSFFIAQLL